MKVWKWLAIVTAIFLSGCATVKNQPESRDKVMSLYLQAMTTGRVDAVKAIKDNFKITKSFGYVQPYVPVVQQPEVKAVWIPVHKSDQDADTLVGGHWVYVMVRNSRWFIESQENGSGKIPVIIPFKESVK